MPKNVKEKMHNKLMKAKEVYKSAGLIGKVKVTASKNGGAFTKPIDLQLMQMRERLLNKGKGNVAGKAAPKAQQLVLQPSIIATIAQESSAAEAVKVLSLTDLLLQGEGNVRMKDMQKSANLSETMESNESNGRRLNMFADLSDDDEDDSSKYQLKLQPSLLFTTPGQNNFRNTSNTADSDDDDV